jgi:hypothetical protein
MFRHLPSSSRSAPGWPGPGDRLLDRARTAPPLSPEGSCRNGTSGSDGFPIRDLGPLRCRSSRAYGGVLMSIGVGRPTAANASQAAPRLRLERIVVRHHRRRVEAEENDLVVPENRADGLSRSIRLPIRRLLASSPRNDSVPGVPARRWAGHVELTVRARCCVVGRSRRRPRRLPRSRRVSEARLSRGDAGAAPCTGRCSRRGVSTPCRRRRGRGSRPVRWRRCRCRRLHGRRAACRY